MKILVVRMVSTTAFKGGQASDFGLEGNLLIGFGRCEVFGCTVFVLDEDGSAEPFPESGFLF